MRFHVRSRQLIGIGLLLVLVRVPGPSVLRAQTTSIPFLVNNGGSDSETTAGAADTILVGYGKMQPGAGHHPASPSSGFARVTYWSAKRVFRPRQPRRRGASGRRSADPSRPAWPLRIRAVPTPSSRTISRTRPAAVSTVARRPFLPVVRLPGS